MEIILKLIFWISVLLVLYGYLGYPYFIKFLAKIKLKKIKKGHFEPQVSLLIPVYNEERIIREKIQNTLSLDYPKHKLEIIVASDGSTDTTCQIAKKYISDGVKLFEYQSHQGKFSVINKSAPQAKGEIIVLSDASSMLNTEAIREVVSNFNDPEVGCVCGRYCLTPQDDSLASKGYQTYLNYDIEIKKSESQFNTIIGAHGAFYAIRKELLEPIPEYLINDDFYIPMKVVAGGHRAIYEEKAVASDKIKYSMQDEFRRRIRIGVGNWQQIFALRNIFGVSSSIAAWQFFSHKVLRMLIPFLLIIALILSAVLEEMVYKIFLYYFILLIGLALLASLLQRLRFRVGFLYMPFFFIVGNIAYLFGTIKFIFGRKRIKW